MTCVVFVILNICSYLIILEYLRKVQILKIKLNIISKDHTKSKRCYNSYIDTFNLNSIYSSKD